MIMHESDQPLSLDPVSGDTIRVSPDVQIPIREIQWKFSRSSGPGGQNVNKVSTRVTLIFDVEASTALTREQKARIRDGLRSYIDRDGIFRIDVDSERSQLRNRTIAVKRFRMALARAIMPPRIRTRTRVPAAEKQVRLRDKKHRSAVKLTRKAPPDRDDQSAVD